MNNEPWYIYDRLENYVSGMDNVERPSIWKTPCSGTTPHNPIPMCVGFISVSLAYFYANICIFLALPLAAPLLRLLFVLINGLCFWLLLLLWGLRSLGSRSSDLRGLWALWPNFMFHMFWSGFWLWLRFTWRSVFFGTLVLLPNVYRCLMQEFNRWLNKVKKRFKRKTVQSIVSYYLKVLNIWV